MSKMGQWNGFYSEVSTQEASCASLRILNDLQLALYKSARYLLPLQGDIVPHVMGVYTRPGKIDIIMDLPHPVFWIEASPSMPMVLKDRVVEAFQKLHERGVVHGDVALRHILIGADARVTLIDFQASRADDPNEDLGLSASYPGDKALEMRRVKFLLNMDNARKKEFRKSKAALKRTIRNRERERRRQELLKHGITVGLPLDEPEPLDDIKDPPIPLDELERYWMEDANDDPRRFVVPGSSDSDVAGAISSFLQCIQDMEGADCGWSVVCNGPSSPRSPLASSTPPPHRDQASVLELPLSIKIRDFAYETTCWRPSISYPRAERGMESHDSSSPLFSVEGSISGDRATISLHAQDSLKRPREDGEAKAIYLEKLPTGKRARLDFLFSGCGDATVTKMSSCDLAEVHSKDRPVLPVLVLGHVPADGRQGDDPLIEPESEHLIHKRSREVAEVDDIGDHVIAKKPRRFCRTA